MLVGADLGGWIAAEMMVRSTVRFSCLVLAQPVPPGTCFAGTPDDVYSQIKALHDSVGGFGNLLMFGQGGFLDHADTVANITLFAKEVMPRLRKLSPLRVAADAAAAQ